MAVGVERHHAAAMARDYQEGEEGMHESTSRTKAGGRGYEYGGPAVPGGLILGIGLGILLGDFFAWLLIGIGAGFILMGFIAAIAGR